MIGGFHNGEVNEDTRAVWNSVAPGLEANANWVGGQTWEINAVQSQVVAGTNYIFHVTSNDGHKKSVKVFVPLPYTGNPAEVSGVAEGHVESSAF